MTIEIDAKLKRDKKRQIYLVWALHMLGIATFLITSIIACFLSYNYRDKNNTLAEKSHYEYSIQTFWIILIGYALGWLLTWFTFLGFAIIFITTAFYVVRCVNALLKAAQYKTVENLDF